MCICTVQQYCLNFLYRNTFLPTAARCSARIKMVKLHLGTQHIGFQRTWTVTIEAQPEPWHLFGLSKVAFHQALKVQSAIPNAAPFSRWSSSLVRKPVASGNLS